MQVPKKLSQRWERRLARFGLSKHQLDAPAETLQFDPASDNWQKQAARRVSYEELTRFHEVGTEAFPRTGHDWANSDSVIRTLLLALYPNLSRNLRQRELAGITCLLIYRYFRLCEPSTSIARDLKITPKAVDKRIARIKNAALSLQGVSQKPLSSPAQLPL